MTSADYIQLIQTTLKSCLVEHLGDIDNVNKYFSVNYEQTTDGKVSDYKAFTDHLIALKEHIEKIELTIVAIAQNGNTVFTHHNVIAHKRNGTVATYQVLAHFTVDGNEGKILRCNELIRQTDGEGNLQHV